MNSKGIKFIDTRTRPLAIDSVEKAVEVMAKEIDNRDRLAKTGEVPAAKVDAADFARHLLWLVGFDALTEDRKVINNFTSKLVEEG